MHTVDIYKQFLETAPTLFYAVDEKLTYKYINNFFGKIHRLSPEKAVGMHISDVIGERDFNTNLPHYQKVLAGECVEYRSSFVKRDGNTHYFLAIYKPLKEDDKVVGFTAVIIDKTAENKLELLSNTDPLTHIANRRKFENDLKCLIHEQQGALIILDIDHFKKINDEFGHGVGDKVLNSFSKHLQSLIAPLGQTYRIGGEEFACILRNVPDDFSLKTYSEHLCEQVAKHQVLDNRAITISLGATYVTQHDERKTLLKRTDSAMYKAKTSGRNQAFVVAG